MNFKTSMSVALVVMMSFVGFAEASYDLPKVKVLKERSSKNPKKEKVIKSDWKDFAQFEEKIKIALEKNSNLPPSAQERIGMDKNLVFVAFYKGYAYFLDRYSIEVIKDEEKEQSWEQHIFPVGEKVHGKNSFVTVQKFCYDGKNIYNSSRRKNDINDVEDAEDKKFLEECFKVGYYYSFKEGVDLKKF